jgi:hypothetical protein
MTEKTVTISCRITPEQKIKLAQRSDTLGMKLTHYIELLVLDGFDRHCQEADKQVFTTVNEPITYKDWLPDKLLPRFKRHLAIIKKRYPDYTDEMIITACVTHAEDNHRAWIQWTLKSYLKQIKKRHYDD